MTDFSLFNLAGKKALVTGGAVGIGRTCATAEVVEMKKDLEALGIRYDENAIAHTASN